MRQTSDPRVQVNQAKEEAVLQGAYGLLAETDNLAQPWNGSKIVDVTGENVVASWWSAMGTVVTQNRMAGVKI